MEGLLHLLDEPNIRSHTNLSTVSQEENMIYEQEQDVTSRQEEKRKPSTILVIGLVIGLLLIAGIVFLLFRSGFLGGPSARARTLTSVNLREGPGIHYRVVGGLPAETEVTVVGRSKDGSWLVVKTESGKAWMTAASDFVEIDAKALSKLPVVETPPPSYDASNVNVERVLNQIPLVIYHRDHFTCVSHGGLNNLLMLPEDGNVIGPHSGDFALVSKGGNVLFEYANGTLRLIRDNPIARFDNGEKYLPLEKALKMFEDGEIVWTGRFGDWPGRGVPGCDKSAKP
jgi:hypothetical protein